MAGHSIKIVKKLNIICICQIFYYFYIVNTTKQKKSKEISSLLSIIILIYFYFNNWNFIVLSFPLLISNLNSKKELYLLINVLSSLMKLFSTKLKSTSP